MTPESKRLIGFLLIVISSVINVLTSRNNSLNKFKSFTTSLITALLGFYILII